VLYGDTNGDGRITAVDSTSIINYISGSMTTISGAKLLALDVNRDGRLTALDSTAILNHVSGGVQIH